MLEKDTKTITIKRIIIDKTTTKVKMKNKMILVG